MRKQILNLAGIGVSIGLLVGSVACTGSGASLTSPSLTAGSSQTTAAPATTGATIAGTVAGASSSAGQSGWRSLEAAGVTVTIETTSLSAVVDSSGHFTLTDVPPIEVVLKFSGPGVDARLTIGAVAERDHMEISVTVSGSSATLDSHEKTGTNQTVEAEGLIDSINAGARRFVVKDRLVEVAADAVIRRVDAIVGFENLRQGDRVHVRGIKDGTTIRASEVVAKYDTPAADVDLRGTIGAMAGACPSLSLKIGDVYVSTSSATQFGGKSCGDLRTGDDVTVVGKKPGSIVLAAKVTVHEPEPPPPATVTFSGSLKGFAGTCPTLNFKVDSTYVRSNSNTAFSGKSCGEAKVGDFVSGAGSLLSDGTIMALTFAVNK